MIKTRLCFTFLLVVLATTAVSGATDNAPKPTSGNPPFEYPQQAEAEGIEGEVRYRADIDKEGRVLSVEILSVPKPGLGFEAAVQSGITNWRFEPATVGGRAVRAQYEGAVEFILMQPTNRARIFPMSRTDLWASIGELTDELGFGLKLREENNGILITKELSINQRKFPGLKGAFPDEIKVKRCELHIFVPPNTEPARLYLGTIVKAYRHLDKKWTFVFNSGHIEQWFFEKLEERIGVSGLPLPKDYARRIELAEQLLPGSVPAECKKLKDTMIAGWSASNPSVIPSTKMSPMYPSSARLERQTGRVALKAVIYEDGAVGDLRIARGADGNREFDTAAIHTVSFWRYRPALLDSCPVAVFFSVWVEFKLH